MNKKKGENLINLRPLETLYPLLLKSQMDSRKRISKPLEITFLEDEL